MRGARSLNVTATGFIAGAGPAGLANSGTIATLTNRGTISGGTGFRKHRAPAWWLAVANSGTITKLTNSGEITGLAGSRGGAGVSNASGATIGSFNNAAGGTIIGGGGVSRGGAGVSNESGAAISSLVNAADGTISGGVGLTSGAGGAGVANSGGITTLTNQGAIGGGNGGKGFGFTGFGGAGGAGASNSGTITTLINNGTIFGGNGGDAQFGIGGAGGAGISNAGTIATLANSGPIIGGAAAPAPPQARRATRSPAPAPLRSGRSPTAARSSAMSRSTIRRAWPSPAARAQTFGPWTGGAITIGAGNLTFAGGTTALGDNVRSTAAAEH